MTQILDDEIRFALLSAIIASTDGFAKNPLCPPFSLNGLIDNCTDEEFPWSREDALLALRELVGLGHARQHNRPFGEPITEPTDAGRAWYATRLAARAKQALVATRTRGLVM